MILFDQAEVRHLLIEMSLSDFIFLLIDTEWERNLDWRTGEFKIGSRTVMQAESNHPDQFTLFILSVGTDYVSEQINRFFTFLRENLIVTNHYQVKRIEKKWYLIVIE
jgi:hypothetical protein